MFDFKSDVEPAECDQEYLPLRIASGSFDQTIHVWDQSRLDVPDVTQRFSLTEHGHWVGGAAHDDWVRGTAFVSSDTLVSTSSDGSVRLWNVDNGEELPSPLDQAHDTWIRSLAISEDRSWLATGDTDGTLKLWRIERKGRPPKTSLVPEPAFTVQAHEGIINALAFRPNGDALVSGGVDGKIRRWELPQPQRNRPEWQNFFRMRLDSPFLILLDCSGSMEWDGHLATIMTALRNAIRGLQTDGMPLGNVVCFRSTSGSALGEIMPLDEPRLDQMLAFFDDPIDAEGNSLSGGTLVEPGMEIVAQEARAALVDGLISPDTKLRILLVTDGQFDPDKRSAQNRRLASLFTGVPVRLDALSPRLFLDHTDASPVSADERNMHCLCRLLGGHFGPSFLLEDR